MYINKILFFEIININIFIKFHLIIKEFGFYLFKVTVYFVSKFFILLI